MFVLFIFLVGFSLLLNFSAGDFCIYRQTQRVIAMLSIRRMAQNLCHTAADTPTHTHTLHTPLHTHTQREKSTTTAAAAAQLNELCASAQLSSARRLTSRVD